MSKIMALPVKNGDVDVGRTNIRAGIGSETEGGEALEGMGGSMVEYSYTCCTYSDTSTQDIVVHGILFTHENNHVAYCKNAPLVVSRRRLYSG